MKLFKVAVSKEEQEEAEGFIKSAAAVATSNYDKTLGELLQQLSGKIATIRGGLNQQLEALKSESANTI